MHRRAKFACWLVIGISIQSVKVIVLAVSRNSLRRFWHSS